MSTKSSRKERNDQKRCCLIKKATPFLVAKKLHDLKLVVEVIDNETLRVKCPWGTSVHPDRENTGIYRTPKIGITYGEYKCCCRECEGRDIFDFLTILKIDLTMATYKAVLNWDFGARESLVEQLLSLSAETGEIYEYRNKLHRIWKTDGVYKVLELQQADFQHFLDKRVVLARFDKRQGKRVPIDVPHNITSILLALKDKGPIPKIKRIAETPFILDDGQLFNQAGYDKELQIFGIYDPKLFDIPKTPTETQIRESWNFLVKIFKNFGFKNPEDQAAALSAVLTGVIRGDLESAPMFLVTAPASGAGKSLLCKCIALFATKHGATEVPFSVHEDEFHRQLITSLQANPKAVVFDNLIQDIPPIPTLCTAITSEFITQRKMRSNTTQIKASTKCLLLANGINVKVLKDMTRRTIVCHLKDAPHANLMNPMDFIQQNWEQCISCALTVLLGCHQLDLGRHIQKEKWFGGFDKFWDWCIKPVIVLLGVSPMKNTLALRKSDPDHIALVAVLALIEKHFAFVSITAQDFEKKISTFDAEELELLDQIEVIDTNHKLNTRKLGRWLSAHCEREVKNRMLTTNDSVVVKRYRLTKLNE